MNNTAEGDKFQLQDLTLSTYKQSTARSELAQPNSGPPFPQSSYVPSWNAASFIAKITEHLHEEFLSQLYHRNQRFQTATLNYLRKCKGYDVSRLADTNLGRSYKLESNVLIYILHTSPDFKVPVFMISETNGLQ